MMRTVLALALALATSPLLAQGGYRYHSGGYEYRSYEYQSYQYPTSRYVGRPGNGYYPNRTSQYHYTSPRITTGQGFVDPYRARYRVDPYRAGYVVDPYRAGYRGVNPYGGYGYTRSGYGSAVPRYYGR